MKKVVALLIALGLTSVFASEANATGAEKDTAKKAEKKAKKAKKAKKEANATEAGKDASK
jgi:nitrate reductase cytochrome c-type subunit